MIIRGERLMLFSILFLIVGFILLVVGAELLVRGASRIALAFGISPLVVGLTVVAFGTSAPEAAVSTWGVLAGQSGVAIGNVVGSNIFNILFVLGLSACITPLIVSQQVVRLEVPIMIGVSCLMWALAADRTIGRTDGALLFAGIITYTVWAIRKSRGETREIAREYEKEFGKNKRTNGGCVAVQIVLIIVGVGLLVSGSQCLVKGAVAIAELLGVNDLIIGLTIVSAGTSLPEVAASVVAAIKGERDIAVGNAVGSNLFNILAVLGLSGLVAPHGIPVPAPALALDIPVMVGVAVACLPVFFTAHRISRWEGAVFLGFYVLYVAYLVMAAVRFPELLLFRHIVTVFILPLTGIGLLASVGHTFYKRWQNSTV